MGNQQDVGYSRDAGHPPSFVRDCRLYLVSYGTSLDGDLSHNHHPAAGWFGLCYGKENRGEATLSLLPVRRSLCCIWFYDDCTNQGTGRSEEHTSELQSR